MSVTPNIILDVKILVGFGLIVIVSVINTKVPILPVSNFSFLLTSAILWFISLCSTLFCLQKLLQKKEPLQLFFKLDKTPTMRIKPNIENVKVLTEDINKYFISKWYFNISHNEEFPEQSKLLLQELITRLVEVQLLVSNKLLLQGTINLFLRHLKEFRRSLKRKEKYGGKIEQLYRYSHVCSNDSKKAKNYFVHQITTNLLRHFINSELWNSLPFSVLLSILSRKFTSYLLNLSSNPDILNYLLLNSVASEEIKHKLELENYARISITEYFDVIDSMSKATVEKMDQDIENNDSKNLGITFSDKNVQEKPLLNDDDIHIQNLIVETNDTKGIDETSGVIKNIDGIDTIDKKSGIKEKKQDHTATDSPESILPIQRRLSSDPVKIYEPKFSKSNKTWRDSKDLGLGISLGQDPLDALPVTVETMKTFGKGTFWDTGKIEHFVEDSSAHILSEMKHTTQSTMEGIKSSMKPLSDATVNTLHNIKDLQETTVNSALHKIGDFQDEAASMVEGIFDLGKAGFRKGLRLTGLQDNIENAKATLNVGQTKNNIKKKILKTTKAASTEKSVVAEECLDTVWMNPLTMDSPNFDGQILLESSNEKSRRTNEKEERELQIPFISMEEAQDADINSPDPEYEDAADLASSIAKLRSLLQQRSSESSMSTPALSPMPPDDFEQKTVETESVSDLEEMDGFMPSFYKFCAKTATGVLDKTIHTIKTALPGTAQGIEQNDNAWIFVQTSQSESDVLTRMKKLLTDRKEYCTVDTEIDTAYEAIDSLDLFQQSSFSTNVEFEDELDDFEVKLPITKSLVDILCELLSDTDTFFIQEPIVKAILLGLGGRIEKYVLSNVDAIMNDFCQNLLIIPEKSNQKILNMDLDMYVEAILSGVPDIVKITVGKTALIKAFTLLISSLQVQRINEDVVLQIFELISMKLIEESNQLSPPASA